jgi:hypothetical protein
MTAFDRFGIKVVAGLGLCGAALALSPDAAAAPLKTGGYACMQGTAGAVGAPAVGAPAVAGAAAPCVPAAPIADMAGGAPYGAPVIGPVPAGAPIPAGAPVPAGAGAPAPLPFPAGAPVIALGGAPVPGAVLTDTAGVAGGKGAPVGPVPTSGPQPGQPLPAGPTQ